MFSITKELTFHAGHRLRGMPEGHPCRNIHGHTYKLIATIADVHIGRDGLVADFGLVSKVVKDKYDHKWLGDGAVGSAMMYDTGDGELQATIPSAAVVSPVMSLPASVECIALSIGRDITAALKEKYGPGGPLVTSIELWETPTSYAVISANDQYDPFEDGAIEKLIFRP